MDRLPCDVIATILTNLPVKSVVQCRVLYDYYCVGFNMTTKEFMVVRMFFGLSNDDEASVSNVEVHTLGSNSWRNLGEAPSVWFIGFSSVFVNGSLHWLAKSKPKDGSNGLCSMLIVSFNLSSENFGVISFSEFGILPHSVPEDGPIAFQLVTLGRCLSVVDSCLKNPVILWVLKNYNVMESWTRYIIRKCGSRIEPVQMISYGKNGDILLLYGSNKLMSYNIESQTLSSLKGGTNWWFYTAFSYVESLISVKSLCKTEDQC
ncbi:hypothetical protein IFM89_015498 [Coptis chinensis]|uniref:F-box associated beta-propeller type 1 domain-containing protein n=1 Tax=Coptis chinensis TaxID=261450 RepID=A0A835GXN3_9MAGN|nr:hypothetical protein IFM89_015498 [Coptis chinensis]